MAPSPEAALYPPVRDFLVAQGFTVRGEVQGCDVVGVRSDAAAALADDVVVVELKRGLTVDLLAQAVRRQKLTDAVYVAIPRPAGAARERSLRDLLPLLRRLELGLLVVEPAAGTVDVRLQPLPVQRRREPKRRRALLAEVAARSADETPGGTHARRLMTAYRESAIHIAVALEQAGAATPAALRALGTGPRTLAILRGNAYGWFERVERGVYGLAAAGFAGLAEWAPTADRKRAGLAAAGDAVATGAGVVTTADAGSSHEPTTSG